MRKFSTPTSVAAGKCITSIFFAALIVGQSGATAIAAAGPGSVTFSTSCSDEAESFFENGLNLLHHMMYDQAEQTFTDGIKDWPDCAMLHWGVAMSKIHPLWPGLPSEETISDGQKAVDLMNAIDGISDLERVFANAVSAFYATDNVNYRDRINAWAVAQKKAYSSFNDNVETTTFYALSLLATAPRGDKTFRNQKDAGQLLKSLDKTTTFHPAVYHYSIHAYDNPELYEQGLPFAQEYGNIAPAVPHALHMPAHIFVRAGQWEETISWNERSAKAALAQSTGKLLTSHYAHAMDYLIYAHLQRGEFQIAENLLADFIGVKNQQSNFGAAYALAASPMRVLLEQERWQEAAEMSTEMHSAIAWEKFPQCVAMLWFGKGISAARIGQQESAATALTKLQEIKTSLAKSKQGYWLKLLDAQMLSIEAWMELDRGNAEQAIALQSKAAEIEDAAGKSPVTPGHILPQRELLGDMFTLLKQTSKSNEAYKSTLNRSPNRRRSRIAIK